MDALYCGCRALDIGSASIAEASKNFNPGRSVWMSVGQNKVSSLAPWDHDLAFLSLFLYVVLFCVLVFGKDA